MKKLWLLCMLWACMGAIGAWGQEGNVSVWDGTTVETSWYTNNTSTNSYEISSAAQLAGLAKLVNGEIEIEGQKKAVDFSGKTITLKADIVLNEKVLDDGNLIANHDQLHKWTPIGTNSNSFLGTFNGDGHTVKGIYIDGTDNNQGLFGYIGKDRNGEIKNVGVVDSYIAGGNRIGGVCGWNHSGKITSCYNTGSVKASGDNNNEAYAGGVCGLNNGPITSCYNIGSVTASSNSKDASAGGVCGHNNSNNPITSCYNTGSVKASASNSNAYSGGVCGRNGGTITTSYNTGSVTASASNSTTYVGGVCGDYYGNSSSSLLITSSGYLEGSAGKGIGNDTGTTDPDGAKSVTPDELVTALNKIQDTNGKSPWQEKARYENGKLTLPTLGNETAPAIIGQEPEKDNNGIYQISNPAHLRWFAEQVNHATGQQQKMNAKLMNDITLSNLKLNADGTVEEGTAPQEQWTPIGAYGNFPFTGTFDGDGHTVKGIYIDGDKDFLGLFGYLGSNGEIKNVGVVDSYIAGDTYIGGVCGYNNGGKITSCYNTGSVMASVNNNDAYAGGVCGRNYGSITSCYNTGSVMASANINNSDNYTHVGGVCGENNNNGSISSCYNTGSVTANENNNADAGGICGFNNSLITFCYNTGSVTASTNNNAYVGGVCGWGHFSSLITSCYNTGSVKASGNNNTYAGGVCGDNNNGSISSCYNTGSMKASGNNNNTYAGGVCGDNNNNQKITSSGYLEGSAEKGIGNNNGTADSLTPAELVKALNDIKDADGKPLWKEKARYEKGKLTLPTLGNETPPTTSLAVVTVEIVKKAKLIDYRNETIAENTAFEASTKDNFASLINPGTKIEPGDVLHIRYKGGKYDGKISETLEMKLPSRPAAPSAAPTASAITSTSITLQAVNGQEYKLGTNGNWQTSPTFNGLAPKTSYTFYARIAPTNDSFASNPSDDTTIATAEAEKPGPDPEPGPGPAPEPTPTPDPAPIFYTYTIPTVTGAIVEGAGSYEAEEGTRISFRLRLDPRGNGVYPEVSANHWWNTVSHDGNGTYSFRLYEDTRIEIGTVDYTLYEVNCPADTTVNADGTYTTGAGIIATDADGHTAQAFPYAATVSLTAPNNDHRRFVCWWDLTRRQPYTLVLTDDLTATATFEPLHPVANATIALPDGALRIAAGRGYIEVQLSKEATPPSVLSQPVRLYSLAGSLLRQAAFDKRTSAPLRFDNLAAGTYIIACGSFRQMVMVR